MPHIPVYVKTGKSCKWFKNRCKNAHKLKIKAWKKYLHSRDPQLLRNYKQARNYAQSVYRSCRITYENNFCANIGKNSKKFWSYVRTRFSEQSIGPIKENNEAVFDRKIIADKFQKAFDKIPTHLLIQKLEP